VDRRVGRAADRELRLAHLEMEIDLPRRTFAGCDLVPNRSALHGDDLLQTVTPVRGGGQAEEVTDGRPPDGGLERERG